MTMRAEHTRREIDTRGGLQNTEKYSMELLMTDEPPLRLTSQPVTALDNKASKVM